MKILVADDEIAIRMLVSEVLSDAGYDVTLAENGRDALEKFSQTGHDIIFSDIRMPEMTGIELLEEVKNLSENTQFIIMTSHASVDSSIAALKNGAFDYIIKPFEDIDIVVDTVERAVANLVEIREQEYLLSTLTRQNTELGDLTRKFRNMAFRDGLTGLYNHRFAQQGIIEEFDRAKRFEGDMSVIFMDVDNFKIYNDTHGHQPGDEVLKTVGQLLEEVASDSDVVARWGGEEFIVVAGGRNLESACELAEQIRQTIANHDFPHGEQQPLGCLSVSVGVAGLTDTTARGEDIVKRADDAAYKAKEGGRNRTVCCGNDDEMTPIQAA